MQYFKACGGIFFVISYMEVNICITLELNIIIVFSARNRVARFDAEQVLLKDYTSWLSASRYSRTASENIYWYLV